jgi:hypothetical protein
VAPVTTYHIDPGFNYALSQVFGASLLKRLDDQNYELKLRELLQRCGLHSAQQEWNLAHSLEKVYEHLKVNYRCEYVYKNEIARQLLLEKHPDKSATLLREVTSDKAIADIVIVNGNTVAYEIKTELDNFDRLNNQLESYSKLYDQVFVVTHAGAVQAMEERLLPFVGIMVLNKHTQLTEERPAQPITELFDPMKAVLTLRQAELVSAWEDRNGKLPQMGTASIFGYCREWYEQLDSKEARIVFYKALKSRYPAQHQHELLIDSIESIKMLLLGRDLSKRLCNTVRERLAY